MSVLPTRAAMIAELKIHLEATQAKAISAMDVTHR